MNTSSGWVQSWGQQQRVYRSIGNSNSSQSCSIQIATGSDVFPTHQNQTDVPLWEIMENRTSRGVAMNQNFAIKLHYCLEETEMSGLGHIVSWMPHGRSFKVHNRKQFVENVLPAYFDQTSYASFQRQLNMYGFSRITTGLDKHGYYHSFFLRDMPNKAFLIRRIGLKGAGPRRATTAINEPNFYVGMRLMPDPNVQLSTQATAQDEQYQQELQPVDIPLNSHPILPTSFGSSHYGRRHQDGDQSRVMSVRRGVPSEQPQLQDTTENGSSPLLFSLDSEELECLVSITSSATTAVPVQDNFSVASGEPASLIRTETQSYYPNLMLDIEPLAIFPE